MHRFYSLLVECHINSKLKSIIERNFRNKKESVLLMDNSSNNVYQIMACLDFKKTYKELIFDHDNKWLHYHLQESLLCSSYLRYEMSKILFVNMINDKMNRESAKIAVKIVQQQSVHFLCFSSTGKFLKVNTLLVNSPMIVK